jgi:MerR family regulatory protein
MQDLGIGELAKRAGVGIDTIRYYERSGLLAPYSRLPSGYRRERTIVRFCVHWAERKFSE